MSGPEDTGKAETKADKSGARRAGDGPGEEEKKARRIHVDMDAFFASM
jgi:hypothetical protein